MQKQKLCSDQVDDHLYLRIDNRLYRQMNSQLSRSVYAQLRERFIFGRYFDHSGLNESLKDQLQKDLNHGQ